MKKLSLILFVAASHCLLAADSTNTSASDKVLTIPASESMEHVNKKAVVTGTIAEVNIAEKLVRLNFDKPYPKQTFTAVVFAAHTNDFPDLEKLKGKKVEVTGKIATYRDRPQIVLLSTNQLKVVTEPKGGTDKAEKK